LWFFRAAALGVPFLLLGMAEVFFRVFPGLYEDRDPFVNVTPTTIFSPAWTNGVEYYNITHANVLAGSAVHFPVQKPAQTVRIFAIGSSACASWPHGPSQTFTAYVQQSLQTAYPDRHFEIINAAAHGFAAYRTRHVLDEVVKMQPDAVLVWEGNNEFLEDRNYDAPNAVLVALARHLRTFRWMNSLLARKSELSGAELKGVATAFFQKGRAEPVRTRSDPEQFAQVKAHFQESFQHMVDRGKRYHVPIILCTVPVNLRDWVPTVSINRLEGDRLRAWEKLYYHALNCLQSGEIKEGIGTMKQAIAMEKEHGESYFWLGRLLEADGQKDAAWEAYSQARDLDYNPFRAISAFNDIIRTLAAENRQDGVCLLDLEEIFKRASKGAAPGFDLFLDYVHPTKPANLLVARSVYDLVVGSGWVGENPAVDRFTYREVPYGPKGEPYDESKDLRLQLLELNMATINRQIATVVSGSEHLLVERLGRAPTGPDDPELAQVEPEFAQRYVACRRYEDVERRLTSGEALPEAERKAATQQLQAFYDKWWPYGRY
jgi:tetratricopeptide (TPR) repeat protein